MLTDFAYRKLTDMIYRGRLRPGERIVERQLARQLGISRIPLRESLARLESEGLIRSDSNRATYVEDFGPADALEIYSMRLLLEPFAAQSAAADPSPRLVKRLRTLLAQMTGDSRQVNFKRLAKTDLAFHLAIVCASGHKRLIRAYESCHVRVIPSELTNDYLSRHPPQSTMQEHEQIMAAIEQGRCEDAEQAMRGHLALAAERLSKALSGGDSSSATRSDG